MPRTDAEQVQYLQYELDQTNQRFNEQFHRLVSARENNDRLRTELDIVKGWIGCWDDETRKRLNAEWVLARANAALEATAE